MPLASLVDRGEHGPIDVHLSLLLSPLTTVKTQQHYALVHHFNKLTICSINQLIFNHFEITLPIDAE